MKTKLAAAALVVAVALAAGYMLRSGNRADAAPGDCYSDAKGPNEPTICG